MLVEFFSFRAESFSLFPRYPPRTFFLCFPASSVHTSGSLDSGANVPLPFPPFASTLTNFPSPPLSGGQRESAFFFFFSCSLRGAPPPSSRLVFPLRARAMPMCLFYVIFFFLSFAGRNSLLSFPPARLTIDSFFPKT